MVEMNGKGENKKIHFRLSSWNYRMKQGAGHQPKSKVDGEGE